MAEAYQLGKNSSVWEVSELAKKPEGKAMLDRHLVEITGGAAFKGSQRSAQFLEYVVHQSAMGHTERLKERLIGVELFGRMPSYDTGEDAIVRVTATDVRKRLSLHYSRVGSNSDFRINLPPGKYVPEVIRSYAPDAINETAPISTVEVPRVVEPPAKPAVMETSSHGRGTTWLWLVVSAAMMVVGLVLAVLGWQWRSEHRDAVSAANGTHSAPWVSFFDGSQQVLIVASDPNIEEIQRISHSTVDLSDYANQHYLPRAADHMPPMQVEFMQNILRGDKISSVDGAIIAGLASLAPAGQFKPIVKGARVLRTQDLESNDNIVLLGSPRSNPWTLMYEPMLDFRFAFDEKTQTEYIENMHPAAGEKTKYMPTAPGFGTGESFATISLIQNPGHSGRIMILAGADGEGTDAAGSFVTDAQRWDSITKPCRSDTSKQPLQLLLKLGTMAGAAKDVTVLACHVLQPAIDHN